MLNLDIYCRESGKVLPELLTIMHITNYCFARLDGVMHVPDNKKNLGGTVH